MRRQHGFQWPWNWQQILTYLVFFLDLISFYMITIHTFAEETSAKVAIGIFYFVAWAILFGLLIIGTKIDPSDPNYYISLDLKQKGNELIYQEGQLYWAKWKWYWDNTSKHWGKCNRWVINFDHHWKWLNNCIGSRNYKLFIYILVALILLNLFNFAFYSSSIVRHFVNISEVNETLYSLYGRKDRILSVSIKHKQIGI